MNLKKLPNAYALSLWRLTLSISLSLLQNRFLAGWTCRVNIPTLLLDFFYWKCIYPIIVFVSMSSNLSISTRTAYYHWITIDTKEICLCLFLGITKTLFLEWFILLSFLHILRIVHTHSYTSTPKIGERLST